MLLDVVHPNARARSPTTSGYSANSPKRGDINEHVGAVVNLVTAHVDDRAVY